MSFCREVRHAMEERGISAYQLSRVTGISEAQLSRFFNGDGYRGLSIPALIKVLDHLGLELRVEKKD